MKYDVLDTFPNLSYTFSTNHLQFVPSTSSSIQNTCEKCVCNIITNDKI